MTSKNKQTKSLESAYTPKNVEDRWYDFWERKGLFHVDPDPDGIPFTVVIPPPNITGMLTMGHVLNNTLQDIFVRWHRLLGERACWIPGTDHAGIATQTVVEKELKRREGLTRHDLGREAFLKLVWKWRDNYGDIILRQLRKLGVSCDWERLVFTMDPALSKAVTEAFVRLYRKGLIYRGKRIINWDPVAHTALSDEEVEHREQQGKLYYFRYPLLKNGIPSAAECLVVATTRPETMLGDTAVAVHPQDRRYSALIGRTVLLPLINRELPVIADEYVDPAFGTGVVKITPAHDPNDFEVGERHGLPRINVMNVDATINENGGPYQGLDRFTARERVIEDLQAQGLVEKIEDHTHAVGYSYRTHVPVEPRLSDQWFVNMKPLAEPALRAVREGHVRFSPERWFKVYEHWMTNIRDWTISRQLWWGHRIPVYYCDGCGWRDALTADPGACPSCGSANPRQDEDVLDTWFSSWLWPFSVHHWPEDSADLRYFYPTSLLVPAPDIIFFWVARMIMAGLEFMPGIPLPDGSPRKEMRDLVPFRDVYFTSIIRDEMGRKMSKSLGNSPDPLDVIRDYGADALRFTVVYLAPLGQDVLFSTSKCELGRNFANKIWNAARFLLMNRDAFEEKTGRKSGVLTGVNPVPPRAGAALEDRWIFSRLNETTVKLRNSMERCRVNEAARDIYEFIWRDFCDWYIELVKERLYSEDENRQSEALERALTVFDSILRLLHPFMPFITEELWHQLDPGRGQSSIMQQRLPDVDESLIDPEADSTMEYLQTLVESVRSVRGEMSVPPSKACSLVIISGNEAHLRAVGENPHFLERLARIGRIDAGADLSRPPLSAGMVVLGDDVYMPLEGLIDIEAERRRISREAARIEGLLAGIASKLGNEKFTASAPAEVVGRERDKERNFLSTLEKLRNNLAGLESE